MDMNEFKRELSKVSGVDFFNPKYRELFKKYFPAEKNADDDQLEDADGVDEEEINNKIEDIDEAEDEREIDKIKKNRATTPEKRDEEDEAIQEESQVIGDDVDELKTDKTSDELLEARIENALLRGGVREEKLGAAMRLAKSEIRSLDDLDKVKEILSEFPEWVHGYKAKGFGMDVDNGSDGLTEEEKRLKAMGINPRD